MNFIIKRRLQYLIMLILLGFGSIAFAQNRGKKEESSFSMPILRECKDTTIEFLERMKNSGALQYKYSPFDVELISHQSLVGYIAITLKRGLQKDTKEALINRIIGDCYPDTSTSIDRSKQNWGIKFQDLITNMKKKGKLYLEADKNKINIYFNFNLLERGEKASDSLIKAPRFKDSEIQGLERLDK